VFCDLEFGKATETLADTSTVIDVTGAVAINNDSNFGPAAGQNCGQISVNVAGPGDFSFGRQAAINGYFCAPERTVQLGHDNNLTGRFFGSVISGDSNHPGFCCLAGPRALCSGFDSFVPATASVGATITLFSTCSLAPVTEVHICGKAAPIVSQADDKLEATVPAGVSGAC